MKTTVNRSVCTRKREPLGTNPMPRKKRGSTSAADAPIETIEEPEQLDLGALIPEGRDVYALEVTGTSMIEDAIAGHAETGLVAFEGARCKLAKTMRATHLHVHMRARRAPRTS